MKPMIRMIAAIDDRRGIARAGKIPWDLPSDQKHWQDLTEHKTVVVGNTTYEKLEESYAASRKLYVVSYEPKSVPNVTYVQDAKNILRTAQEDMWVIGGGQIFKLALPFAKELHLTRVEGDFGCDTYFPEFEDKFKRISYEMPLTENGVTFHYETWAARAAE